MGAPGSVTVESPRPPATRSGARALPERPLRVLFLNDTSRNGGPGRTLFTILKYLDPAEVHRAVMLPREGVVARSEERRVGKECSP